MTWSLMECGKKSKLLLWLKGGVSREGPCGMNQVGDFGLMKISMVDYSSSGSHDLGIPQLSYARVLSVQLIGISDFLDRQSLESAPLM